MAEIPSGQARDCTSYVYILRCSDGSYYTGWTNRLQARLDCHNGGTGAKYTRSRRPVQLVYYETWAKKPLALRREWEIKQMTRAQKQRLITPRQEKEEPC